MGQRMEAECRDCGEIFEVDHDGGFAFHLLRCDRCGKTKSITFDELGELHIRYLKGLTGPYSVATARSDELARPSGPPISEGEYYAGIEVAAGPCNCGGQYKLDAPPRCPQCRSRNISEGDVTVLYD
jgi:predicted Zn-ribbon and HTH transcriptional regulator